MKTKLQQTKKRKHRLEHHADGWLRQPSQCSGNNDCRQSHSSTRLNCNKNMTFEDCELAVLRQAVDENEKIIGEQMVKTDAIRQIIDILEEFLIRKKLICYGGTAINNILPKEAQFYNKEIEVPDYDFFTPNALNDAKELADIYFERGFNEVEAKAGIHVGTYKVFVNFMPIADITFINSSLFDKLMKDAITVSGIKYAPPNFLRMSMYLELSRPRGDISRWEKVFKRLNILNKYFPMKHEECYMRRKTATKTHKMRQIMKHVCDSFIEQNAVFIGGFARHLYHVQSGHTQYKEQWKETTNCDVLHENPEKCAMILMERLKETGYDDVRTEVQPPFGEIVPERTDILLGEKVVASIYKTVGCHNYNSIMLHGNTVNIATIDTIMSFYLAFIYADGYETRRIGLLCMAKKLFEMQTRNRLNQEGVFKRFSMKCVGKQPTLETIRHEKNEMFKRLANKKDTKEYELYFLNYRPDNMFKINATKPNKKNTTKRKTVKLNSSRNLLQQFLK